ECVGNAGLENESPSLRSISAGKGEGRGSSSRHRYNRHVPLACPIEPIEELGRQMGRADRTFPGDALVGSRAGERASNISGTMGEENAEACFGQPRLQWHHHMIVVAPAVEVQNERRVCRSSTYEGDLVGSAERCGLKFR